MRQGMEILKVSLRNELRLVHVRTPSERVWRTSSKQHRPMGLAALNKQSLLCLRVTVRCLFEFRMPRHV